MNARICCYVVMTLSAALCTGSVALAQSPFDPVKDDPKLPRVLLIGDSISIGYTVPVQRLLKGKANVHRIPVNGQFSAYGLASLKTWLGDGKWDLIHFNWGIWDTHTLDSTGAILSAEDEAVKPGKIRTTIAEYQENLGKIVDILEPTGAKLIWATSTPMPTRKGDRNRLTDKYNAAAASVMHLRLVAIDDLSTAIKPHLKEMQLDDGCHFTDRGYEFLGKQVAEYISKRLSKPNKAYPAFTNTSSDEKHLDLESDAPDQNGQMNAYFRWTVLDDEPGKFAIELRLVQQGELDGKVTIPSQVTTDITPRRLQHLSVKPGRAYNWRIEQVGRLVASGSVTADERGLLTIPRVKVSAKPIALYVSE